MVSVIIPAYNVEHYIKRCLESVAAQTYEDLEIIIVNDGSLDHTDSICRAYAARDKRIRYIKTDNRGRSEARNLGIKKARGEYIAFLDADDWWDGSFVEKMTEGLMYGAGKAEIAVCDIVYVDAQTGSGTRSDIRLPRNKPVSVTDEPDVINRCRTFLWGKLYRKSLFTDNNVYLKGKIAEDFPIVPLLAARAQGVIRVPQALQYYYRNRTGSSSDDARLVRQEYVGGIRRLADNFKQCGMFAMLREPLYKLAYSQARFALQQTARLARMEKAGQREKDELEAELTMLLGGIWDRTPPFHKRFAWRGQRALYEGLKRLAVTEDQIVPEAGDYDYLVTDTEITHPKLTGEGLYWDIADTLLYKLS